MRVLPEPPAPNIEAYQLHLKGVRWLADRLRQRTASGIRLLEKAIAIDRSLGALTRKLHRARQIGGYRITRQRILVADAERNAQRALALDPEVRKLTRASSS